MGSVVSNYDPSKILAEGQDPDGVRVVLEQRAWEHIVWGHPEMERHLHGIMAVPGRADHRIRDREYANREWFYRSDLGPTDWLGVLVEYGDDGGRVITAYGTNQDPPGWISE